MNITDNNERHHRVCGGVCAEMIIGSGQRRGCGGGVVVCAEDDNRKWPATWLWWCWFVRKMTIGSSQRGG